LAQFSGQPGIINRFLGYLDADDATNIPVGLAALARNCTFDLTSVRTRDGFNTTMQGINQSPITGMLGMLYTPETATEDFFQLPVIFDKAGALQYEKPVGTGFMHAVPAGLFTPPANAHMIATQTYNKGWLAFSDLTKPLSRCAVLDPKTLNLDPYGMKPFGWTWLASTQVIVGEMATPTVKGGNGHTYRCIQAGTTGTTEPVWSLTENATFFDGTAEWEELTAVIANRLPAPDAAIITRLPAGGTFPAGRDVYIMLTYLNAQGETIPSVPSRLVNTNLNDAVQIAIPALASLAGWIRGLQPQYVPTSVRVYEADVPTGNPAPPETSYELVNSFALGTTATVTTTATSGIFPPTLNSARVTPGQLPTPDIEPVITRVSAGGAFPAGRDVYVLQTYSNSIGETTAGPANSIIDTQLNDGVQVTVEAVDAFPQITTINIYEADVLTGKPAPNSTQFALVGSFAPGDTPTITASATGNPPPITNTTGPGGNIIADQPDGGINASQGYRYAALMFMNRNFTVSGFTQASVIRYIVDEDGWEIGIFNVAPGPANVIARICSFTVADGSNAGAFWWIGDINPQVPSQNFVYPQTFLSDNIPMSATVFYDNTTTTGIFNFTDEYLIASNDATDRLRVIWPNQCVHITYCPSVDRIFQTGVPGYYSGCWVSLAADPESYYGDTSFISVGSDDGERAWGVVEYRSTIWLMRERSGLTLTANANNPNEWTARQRWSEKGPCGPRAFDACGKFMIFVHRSGIYKYEDTEPDLMTKEVPYWWKTINWNAATTICCKIDEETHTVHLLVPVGNSKVPNQKIVLNYLEGWNNPIHFSTYSGKEISMDACRKYSIDDMAAFVCTRIERTIPNQPSFPNGTIGIPFTDSGFYTSQFLHGSSAADGTVQAITPGVFNDNGAGIDWQYETVCPQQSMALSKIEGFTLNARGNGQIYAYFLAGRDMVTGQSESGPIRSKVLRVARPIDLTVDQNQGISRMVPSKVNERWRMHFDNGKQADNWASLKWLAIYSIPMYGARDQSEAGG